MTVADIHGPIPDWTCANGHRCAPDEGVCMLCGERPKFEYTTKDGAFVPSRERLRLVKKERD